MGDGTRRNSATDLAGRHEAVGSALDRPAGEQPLAASSPTAPVRPPSPPTPDARSRAHRSPGAAGLGWVGLALAVFGVALVAVLPLALGTEGDRSARLVGYLALVTAAFTTVAGIVFDRARTAGLIGLVLALAGFVLVATLPT